jgi:hypothetical protein
MPMIVNLAIPPKQGTTMEGEVLGAAQAVGPYHLATVLLLVGDMDTDATLDVAVQEADDPGDGSDPSTWTWSDISGAAFPTQYADSAPNTSHVGLIHITGSRKHFFRIRSQALGANANYSAVILFDFARDEPPGAEWRVVE